MQDAEHHFHTLNNGLVLVWANLKAKAKANALWTVLDMKQKVNEQSHGKTCKTSKMLGKMYTWWDHISHKTDITK